MDILQTHRSYLFGIAYRMLGSAMQAEDVLQDAYLRLRDVPLETIQAPKAYLAKLVTRLCLDELKSAKNQRETYPGVWLPEPLITPAPDIETNDNDMDSLSFAFLILLETLSPLERSVFLLREVFDYEYVEIAEMLDKDEAACRQLFSRAKRHIRENRPRYHTTTHAQQEMFSKFLAAVSVGDLDGLMNLLSDDVITWTDSGGQVPAATRPLHGKDKSARFVLGLARKAHDAQYQFEFINGQMGVIVRDNKGQVIMVMLFDMTAAQISRFHYVTNPQKLKLLRLPQ